MPANSQEPEMVGSDCICAQGKWIYSHAADVVHAVRRGDTGHALHLLQHGKYPNVPNRIKSVLVSLSLELEFDFN